LRTAFFDQGLSVTALNNYLTCPWKYFYVNLLRIPQVKEKPMLFGSAIHDALRYYFDAYRKGNELDGQSIVAYFIESLQHLPLSEREIKELEAKGSALLPGYIEKYASSFVRNTFPEHPVTAELPLIGETKSLLLRGTLDRMDILPGGECVVIDYKTGKPKSRNEIEGKTKSGTGDYKRQLIFYALLLKRSDEKRYMERGILDFVEPDEKGRYHREVFTVGEEETDSLEQVIQKVVKDILTLSFIDTHCEAKDCQYCNLRGRLFSGGILT
jgi:DNA helicase-2/ATP-dependent DNA helicase PcrA